MDISRHPLLQQGYNTCLAIEAITASQEQSAASQSATKLLQAIDNFIPSQQLVVGEYAQGKGGFFVGVIRDGDKQWNLFASPMDVGYIKSKWSDDYNEIEGEFSRRDGQHNTNLILAAEPDNKIANHCTALTVGGHKDFYWPSQFEQNLICINLPDQSKPEWHWSSTQYSAYFAWYQHFEDGSQGIRFKAYELAARAVRRELII